MGWWLKLQREIYFLQQIKRMHILKRQDQFTEHTACPADRGTRPKNLQPCSQLLCCIVTDDAAYSDILRATSPVLMWGCMAVKSGINSCSVIDDGPCCAVLNSALKKSLYFMWHINTFAASYLNTQGLNNSCLKSLASTLVDLTFQSRALHSFSLNQLRNLSL